ncbi:unnamed protein product [Vitrella brassicaformis CCMP3155]|uniref:Uncharacterized protein n=2 Tax=Vitrella brassicaformis TaxID=1169539 RepID=A0A0G4GRE7_VITBC|nr:unnamed protein product [Vitrella brassicaformis CCMP3155]|eukprot:CEM33111.1 unnamed protein product [Vitrella brassicaformis CCMP3155]
MTETLPPRHVFIHSSSRGVTNPRLKALKRGNLRGPSDTGLSRNARRHEVAHTNASLAAAVSLLLRPKTKAKQEGGGGRHTVAREVSDPATLTTDLVPAGETKSGEAHPNNPADDANPGVSSSMGAGVSSSVGTTRMGSETSTLSVDQHGQSDGKSSSISLSRGDSPADDEDVPPPPPSPEGLKEACEHPEATTSPPSPPPKQDEGASEVQTTVGGDVSRGVTGSSGPGHSSPTAAVKPPEITDNLLTLLNLQQSSSSASSYDNPPATMATANSPPALANRRVLRRHPPASSDSLASSSHAAAGAPPSKRWRCVKWRPFGRWRTRSSSNTTQTASTARSVERDDVRFDESAADYARRMSGDGGPAVLRRDDSREMDDQACGCGPGAGSMLCSIATVACCFGAVMLGCLAMMMGMDSGGEDGFDISGGGGDDGGAGAMDGLALDAYPADNVPQDALQNQDIPVDALRPGSNWMRGTDVAAVLDRDL